MEKNEQLAVQQQPQKSTIALSNKGIAITTMDELWRFSTAVANSGMAPKGMERPETILVAIQMGMEIGLTPMSSLQNIAVINGRPSIFGDAAKALVLASSVCEYVNEYYEGEGDELTAWCVSKRYKSPEHKTSFSVADAKKASLWGKNTVWASYGKRMIMMRSRSYNLRDNFADVLKGYDTAEEVADYVEIKNITQPSVEQKTSAVSNTLKNVVKQIEQPKVTVVKDTPTEFKAITHIVSNEPIQETVVTTTENEETLVVDASKDSGSDINPYSMESLQAMDLEDLKRLSVDNLIDYNLFEGKNTKKKLLTLIWECRNKMPYSIELAQKGTAFQEVSVKDNVETPKEVKASPLPTDRTPDLASQISEVGPTGSRAFGEMRTVYAALDANLYSNERIAIGIKTLGLSYTSKEDMSRRAPKSEILNILNNC